MGMPDLKDSKFVQGHRDEIERITKVLGTIIVMKGKRKQLKNNIFSSNRHVYEVEEVEIRWTDTTNSLYEKLEWLIGRWQSLVKAR